MENAHFVMSFLLATHALLKSVLNALKDQFRAERDLQRTRYDQIKYFLFLKRETGALTAEDMIEVGEWLEPGTL